MAFFQGGGGSGSGSGFQAVNRLPETVKDGSAYYLKRDQREAFVASDFDLAFTAASLGNDDRIGFASAAGAAAYQNADMAAGTLAGSTAGIEVFARRVGSIEFIVTNALANQLGSEVSIYVDGTVHAVPRQILAPSHAVARAGMTLYVSGGTDLAAGERWAVGDTPTIRIEGQSGLLVAPDGTLSEVGDENPAGEIEYRKGFYVGDNGRYTRVVVDVVDRLPPNPQDGEFAYVTADYRARYMESDFSLDFAGATVGAASFGFIDTTLAAVGWSVFTNTAGGTAPQLSAAGVRGIYSNGGVGDHVIVTAAVAAALGGSLTVALEGSEYTFSRNNLGVAGLTAAGLALFSANYSSAFNAALRTATTIEITGASGQRVADNGRLGTLETENPTGAIEEKKGYYHSQDGVWVAFGSGGGSVAAAVNLYQNGSTVEGLEIGLEAAGAGADWGLVAEVRAILTDPYIDFYTGNAETDGRPGMRISFRGNTYRGERGNGIRLSTSETTVPAAANIAITGPRYESGANRHIIYILTKAGVSLTLNAVIAALNAVAGVSAALINGASGAEAYDISRTYAQEYGTQESAGGAVVSHGGTHEPLTPRVDATAKTYTLPYDVNIDDLNAIAAAINNTSDAEATLTHGATGTNAPEAAGFTRSFEGRRGVRGPVGPAGSPGPAGVRGADGAPGMDGSDGADGAPGAAGAQGPQGPQGPQGDQGPAGPQADPGRKTRIDPSGSNSRTIQLPTDYRDYAFILIEWLDGQAVELSVDVESLPSTGTRVYRSGGARRATWTASTRQFTLDGAAFTGATLYETGGPGPAGPQGPPGDAGPAGAPGAAGAQGQQGIQGPAGPKGDQGDRGPAGADGSDGADGMDGAVGPRGPAGNDGAAGPQGPPGDRGPAGEDGMDGATGPQGPQGDQGPAGPKGDQGDRGPQGIQGPVGPQGPAGSGSGTPLSDSAILDLAKLGRVAGDRGKILGVASADENDMVLVDRPADGAPGAQGPQGDRGPQGLQGDRGPAGNDGAQGPPGDRGPAGADGSDGAQGPKGDPGDAGAAGAQGPQGPQGPAGPQGPQGPPGAGATLTEDEILAATKYETIDLGAANFLAFNKTPSPAGLTASTVSSTSIGGNSVPAGSRVYRDSYLTADRNYYTIAAPSGGTLVILADLADIRNAADAEAVDGAQWLIKNTGTGTVRFTAGGIGRIEPMSSVTIDPQSVALIVLDAVGAYDSIGSANPAYILTVQALGGANLEPNSVTAAQARANSEAHKEEWRTRIGAASADEAHDSSGSDTPHLAEDNRRLTRLEQLTSGLSLREHEGWADVTDAASGAVALVPVAAFSTEQADVVALTYAVRAVAPANGGYAVVMRVPSGNNINAYRLNPTGSLTDPLHGVFNGGSFASGGNDYYFMAGSVTLDQNDALQVQSVQNVVDYTVYGDEVTKLTEHEEQPFAHQDSPVRVDTLGINAPGGREVYLTKTVHHPGNEHVFSTVLGRLGPNNAAGRPPFVGVSVVDFSSNNGPVATADTSAFPAVLNAARIAGIFEDEGDETFFTVAVNKALSTDAPTHLNVDYGLLAPPEHTAHRIALTQHGADVVIGGQTYRMMRTPGALLVIYLNNMVRSSPPQDPTFYFSLEYPDGFLKADGTIDRGTEQVAGHYESQGNGVWKSRAAIIADAIRATDPQASYAAYRIRTAQALPYPDETYLALQMFSTEKVEVNTSGIISQVSSAGDLNLDRLSLAAGVYDLDVIMNINRNAGDDRAYTFDVRKVSGTPGPLATRISVGPARQAAYDGLTVQPIQTTLTFSLTEASTIEIRARRTTPAKAGVTRTKDTVAGGSWFVIKRLGSVASETFLSSPALARHPVQGVFFQYTNTGHAPAFSAEYRDDVGWHNFGDWVQSSIPANQPPGGGTLYSATTLAVWENGAWSVRTAVIEEASVSYGVQYAATNTATSGTTVYNAAVHHYVRFRQSNGYWGPWIALDGGSSAVPTQLWSRENDFDEILRTAAHFDLNDWNEIGFSVLNKGAATPPQDHRLQRVWLDTDLILNVPAYNASVGSAELVNGVPNFSLINVAVGGPNKVGSVWVGGDGFRGEPSGTWSPWDGLNMTLHFYRGLSDSDADSRAVRGIRTMERVGSYSNPVILTIWGR